MSLRIHMRAVFAAMGLCSHADTVVQHFSMELSNEEGDTVGETLGILGFDPSLGRLIAFTASFEGTISALVNPGPATVTLSFGVSGKVLSHSVGYGFFNMTKRRVLSSSADLLAVSGLNTTPFTLTLFQNTGSADTSVQGTITYHYVMAKPVGNTHTA